MGVQTCLIRNLLHLIWRTVPCPQTDRLRTDPVGIKLWCQNCLPEKKTSKSVWDAFWDPFTLRHFKLPSGPSNEEILKKYFTSHAKTQPVAGLCSKDTTENDSNIDIEVQAQSSPATKCISSDTLNIESPEEGKNEISCITEFSTTELLFTDMAQRCLALFDITSNTTIKKRVLISRPWDTTMLPWSKIAVTLPHSKQIAFFTADHFLFPCCSIGVFGECRGIQCAENKLVVSFTSPHALVQIIDLSGRVLKTIRHDPSGCELFEWPHYIALCPDNKLIYVSDYYRNTISCIDTDGVIKWVYQDGDIHYPKGIVAGDGGCIYVCSWRSNTIHVVSSSNGDRLAFIRCYGVTFPQAACYSSKNRALYVSHGNCVTSISRLSLQ